MVIGNKVFDVKENVYIMGILNVTPDSFSDGGKWNHMDNAKKLIEKYINEGADIIDVGGESTRPGYEMISCEEEINRVLPIVEHIKANYDIPVSVDTYKAKVALAAAKSNVDMINDIWGLKFDDKMKNVIAEYNMACCIMHNREKDNSYNNLLEDVISDLRYSIETAINCGISAERLIIDPGIGFGKNQVQNLEILNKLEALKTLGLPILLGTSRKSVIGNTLKVCIEQRLEGTIATTLIGLMKGVSFFRVHDVKENLRAIKMAQAIINS